MHTPLLIFVVHAACGAIKRELDTIQIPKGGGNRAGVKLNVNHQVAAAMQKFDHEIKAGELTIMGAVYDFRNDLKHGQGKLNIIHLNGETGDAKLTKNPLLAAK